MARNIIGPLEERKIKKLGLTTKWNDKYNCLELYGFNDFYLGAAHDNPMLFAMLCMLENISIEGNKMVEEILDYKTEQELDEAI